MPWNIALILSVLGVQLCMGILMIVTVVLIHPIASSVHATLDDVNTLLPDIKQMVQTVHGICISVGCDQV